MASETCDVGARVLRDDVIPQVAERLAEAAPPRWHGRAEIAALVAACAVLLAGLLTGVRPDLRDAAVVVAVLTPLLVLAAVPLQVKRLRRRVRRSDAVAVDAGPLLQALAPYGVRELTVVVSRSRRVAGSGGRSWRWRGRAVIGVRPEITTSVSRTRFTTAHEAAHLVRHDSLSKLLLAGCAMGLLDAASVGASARAWLLGVPAIAAVGVAWWREFACDRLAAALAGPAAAEAFGDFLHRVVLHLRGLPRGRRAVILVLAWLTHPPHGLRCAVLARFAQRAAPGAAVVDRT